MHQAAGAPFILLPTHNGEPFLREQIISLQAQTWVRWQLVVHDDQSSDRTLAILASMAAADSRITLLPRLNERLGPAKSFARLVEHAWSQNATHAFFCDQDDVWLPAKLELQVRTLVEEEERTGAETPILVHSDLEVVDEHTRRMHRSFRDFNGIHYNRGDPLATLLIHNAVVGCTTGFNRALMTAALPFPAGTFHDWWMALCAAAAGRVLDDRRATVLYRQHERNVVGAQERHAFIRSAIREPRRFAAATFSDFATGLRHAFALEQRALERRQLFSEDVRRRVITYCSAFRRGAGPLARLRWLKASGARPQRATSYLVLYGLAAIYPHMNDG